MQLPLATSHTLIMLFADPDAKYSPFGENTTLYIEEMSPLRILMHSPFYTFHTPMVKSLDPDAKYFPFGENTML